MCQPLKELGWLIPVAPSSWEYPDPGAFFCSCCGVLRAVRAEAEGGRLPAQQQDRSALHEGGQELPPGRGALQEGAGPGAAH